MAKPPTDTATPDVASLVEQAKQISPTGQAPGATAAAADSPPAAAKPAFSFGGGKELRLAQHKRNAKQLVGAMKTLFEQTTALDSQTSAFRLQCASDPEAVAALEAEGLELDKIVRLFNDLNGAFTRFES